MKKNKLKLSLKSVQLLNIDVQQSIKGGQNDENTKADGPAPYSLEACEEAIDSSMQDVYG